MDCPNCKLVNPPTAERCDCGYDFKSGAMKESYLTERDKRLSKPGTVLGVGLVMFVLMRFAARLIVNSKEESSAGQRLFTVLLLVAIAGIWIWNGRRTTR